MNNETLATHREAMRVGCCSLFVANSKCKCNAGPWPSSSTLVTVSISIHQTKRKGCSFAVAPSDKQTKELAQSCLVAVAPLSSSSFLTCSVVACPVVLGLQSFLDSKADGGGGDGDLRQDLNTTIPETEICCSFVSGDSTRPFQYAHVATSITPAYSYPST